MSAGVWVTGIGLVTPLGVGVEASWARLVRGDRALRPIRLFEAKGREAVVAGEVDGVALPDGPTSSAWSRTSAMAATAAAEAMRAASIEPRALRVGLVVGGTTGGMFENEEVLARLHAEPERRELIAQMLSHPLTATGDCLQEHLGPFARVRTLASACSSGANAIAVAAVWLFSGEVDAVVAGGTDGLCRLTWSGFNALGALDAEPCRPFHRRRRGTNLGEGAAFLVLERADRAPRRPSAPAPIAALAGWALGAEAHHITNPSADGEVVAALIGKALASAGLSPRDVDYVNAHGTGTPLNDAMEARALVRAFGADAQRVRVSSSKGQIGHTLGGAGAIEAAITALCVARRTLVPTAGLDDPDPDLGLTHVPHVGVEGERVRAALSNAFGFGGMDTVLVFTQPSYGATPAPARAPAPAPAPAPTPAGVVVSGAAVFGVCGRLGAEDLADLPARAFALDAPVQPEAYLDVTRARRLDRAAALGAVAVEHAVRDAAIPGDAIAETGVLLGSAYGNVDGSAAFMHRIFEKGPRAASPAEFPNLVPSSPVGHASIYGGLRGPTFATADLAVSGESAFAQAAQLVAAGVATRIVAGAVETKSDIVGRVLAALFAHAPSQTRTPRTDLAVALVVEAEPAARGRAARVLARVRSLVEWRGDEPQGARAALAEAARRVPPPRATRVEVILSRPDPIAEEVLGASAWSAAPRSACAPSIGESDALGGAAIAVAVARLGRGLVDEVLVLGIARGRGHAVVLER